MENKEYLTKEEIDIIESEAKDPYYHGPDICGIGKGLAILALSKVNKLIMIGGNEHYGFQHILERHGTLMDFFFDKKGNVDSPSKFRKEITPILDYPHIADSIYLEENLNGDKNKAPDRFDLYQGTYIHYDGEGLTYRLLIYKGTKIIHNLYPIDDQTSKPSRPKKFRFSRGNATSRNFMESNTIEYRVPYKNAN